ncbi:MAG TPA: RodZ domain-containing protein [Thermoanaerobaculia bacterium]|nr:RodZ domain-containing protein [Thermoanaerobaculia bacterium]
MRSGTDLRFGEELRRERIVREITLEEISAATKISIRILTALEESDLSHLPAPAFTRGFIRSYAHHIGVDPEEKVCAYLADLSEQSAGTPPVAIRARTKFWRGRGAIASLIVGGVTALLLLMGLIAKPERRAALRPERPAPARASVVALKNVTVSNEPTPAVRPLELAPVPAPDPAPDTASNTARDAAKDADALVSLQLECDQDSWTKLDASGQTVFVGLIRRGEVKRFEARGGFRLSLGNAGGVRVTVDGRTLESLGRAGEVIRNLPLPPPAARG